MKTMSAYERWQVVTLITQTIILLGTLIVALYIGFKQIQISSQQTEISLKQTEISKNLAELPYVVSAEVTYDPSTKRINIYNKGQTNIFLWGSKMGDGPALVEKEPRLITPSGSYYVFADQLEDEIIQKTGGNGEVRGDLKIYLKNQGDTKYKVSVIIFAKCENGRVSINTQTTSIKPEAW